MDYGTGKNLQASENFHVAQIKVAADTYYTGMRLEAQKAGTPVTAGTGNGVGSDVVAGPNVKSGAWVFTFTAALVGDLADPDGNIIAQGLTVPNGDSASFDINGLKFTLTDGVTAWVATDTVTMTIATAVTYTALDEGELAALFYGVDEEVVSSAAYRQCVLGGDIAESGLQSTAGAAVTLTDADRAAYAQRGFFMQRI